MKFGLRGIRMLLQSLGNPHRRLKTIHIAGTNGKGSTAAMIAAILTSAGYTTGLYTSPHLIDLRERIRINGKPVPQKVVVQIVRRLRRHIQRNRNTFFEAVTAMAFKYFADRRVDIAVIETGLGGRLDATNVIRPEVSVITTIGLEHVEILGRTLRMIAREKAGIIKRGVPCVTGVESEPVLSVLRKAATARDSRLVIPVDVKTNVRQATLRGSVVDIRFDTMTLDNLGISLPGRFQFRNAMVAVAALNMLSRNGHWTISEKSIRKGLANVQRYTGLEARLSIVRRSPLILADVAHNPEAVRSLIGSLRDLGVERMDIVFGVMRDKNYRLMVRILQPVAGRLFLVQPATGRGRDILELAAETKKLGISYQTYASVREGLRAALEQRRKGVPILITGSNFVVGEALASLRGRNYLTINQ
jgi:dihydrofolate synthase/folylpolyglutamate synthase